MIAVIQFTKLYVLISFQDMSQLWTIMLQIWHLWLQPLC